MIALLVVVGWTMLWVYGLVTIWKENLAGHETGVFEAMYIWSFSLLWSAGAIGAIGIGVSGCFVVIISLFTKVWELFRDAK